MLNNLKKIIHKSVKSLGYQIIQSGITDHDIIEDNAFNRINDKCKDYTMTSQESMYALYKAITYLVDNQIPGDFVECGVWKGGSMMLVANVLLELNATDRKLYLYDTYEGLTEPTKIDYSLTGKKAQAIKKWKKNQKIDYNEWCYASLDEVKRNLARTKYPEKNLFFIKGKVEETIPLIVPSKIALLRLDTDWYQSTKHELIHLFPILSNHGILIVDDYGQWAGAQKAVDEYFYQKKILLQRIDHTVRIAVKTDVE